MHVFFMKKKSSCESRMQFLEHFFIDRGDDIFSFFYNFCKPMIFKVGLLFCVPFPNGLSYRIQIALIFQIFRCRLICFFSKSFQLLQKLRYPKLKLYKTFSIPFSTTFLPILKMTTFLLLLAISKRFKIQRPDWTHFVDFWLQINLFFFLSFQLLQKPRYS